MQLRFRKKCFGSLHHQLSCVLLTFMQIKIFMHWYVSVFLLLCRSGVGAPVIGDLDGEYKHDSRRNVLEWCLPVIDANNKTGSLEFSITGQPNDFFPISVSFVSKRNYCDIQVGYWAEMSCASVCGWNLFTAVFMHLAVVSVALMNAVLNCGATESRSFTFVIQDPNL